MEILPEVAKNIHNRSKVKEEDTVKENINNISRKRHSKPLKPYIMDTTN